MHALAAEGTAVSIVLECSNLIDTVHHCVVFVQPGFLKTRFGFRIHCAELCLLIPSLSLLNTHLNLCVHMPVARDTHIHTDKHPRHTLSHLSK